MSYYTYPIGGNDSFANVNDYSENLPFLNVSDARFDTLTVQTLNSGSVAPTGINLTLAGNLVVNGTSTLNNSLTVNSNITASGSITAGNIIISPGTLSVSGVSTDVINCNSILSVIGDASVLSGTLTTDDIYMNNGFQIKNTPSDGTNYTNDWGTSDGVICSSLSTAVSSLVSFTSPFSGIPQVLLTPLDGTQSTAKLVLSVTSLTSSGFTWTVYNTDSSATTANWTVQYFAIGPAIGPA